MPQSVRLLATGNVEVAHDLERARVSEVYESRFAFDVTCRARCS
jgi:hypothetical protein